MSKKFRYYPLKPKTEEGFKKAVAWFGGRELIASLKGLIIYTIYGENNDPRAWMKPNVFPELEEKLNNQLSLELNDENVEVVRSEVITKVDEFWANKSFQQWEWKKSHFSFWEDYLERQEFWKKLNVEDSKTQDEFWFDYISDTGDGQMGVYNVACLCLADLWLDDEKINSAVRFIPPTEAEYNKKTLLPRGSYLFIGGDTAYHSADYTTLFERFQSPFRWAFISVRKFMWENYGLKTSPERKFQFATQDQTIENILNDDGEFNENWDGTFVATLNDNPELWDTEPLRPLFGIPANHDYYDAIAGFNKQFRRPPFKDIQENSADSKFWGNVPLKIHSFSRQQEASYVAINLPFRWWMFGIDSEHSELDNRQKIFFTEIVNKWTPRKLILATPEPTTVFGIKSTEADKTAKYLTEITKSLGYQQPFLNDGEFLKIADDKVQDSSQSEVVEKHCRLDLSGDVHHYARYWGPIVSGTLAEDFDENEYSVNNYASLVAGGGGAFFDSTETLVGEEKVITKDGKVIDVEGEVPPLAIFPGKIESIVKTADKIFDLWNIKKGGYVQNAGGVVAIIMYFCLTQVSNVKDTFNWIHETLDSRGLTPIYEALKHPIIYLSQLENRSVGIGIILIGIAVFFALSGVLIQQLHAKLETEKDIEVIEAKDGRLYQLLIRFIPIFVGLILYLIFILPLASLCWATNSETNCSNDSFANSFYLLLHFIFTGLLVWVALEYGKWLALRTRLAREFKNRTFLQKMQDSLIVGTNPLQNHLGRISREYTLEYIPDTILLVLASLFVILGIGIFGQGSLMKTGADLLFIVALFGGFLMIAIVLGYSTGGSYQKPKGKFIFLLLGTFHWLLQLLTPFFLIYFGNWIFFLVFLLGLAVLFNGLSRNKYKLGILLEDRHKQSGWRGFLWRWANFQLASYLMKKDSPILLLSGWLLFGLFTLLTPLFLTFGIENPSFSTVNSIVISFFVNDVVPLISAYLLPITQIFPEQIEKWLAIFFLPLTVGFLPILAVMAIVGFTGYRTSRIWFSWYLGVSLAFNGHNNEAGGLARIEDFKHILRIRVQKDKLTVFVIGIDESKPDLSELMPEDDIQKTEKSLPNVRLVDKFDLHYQ